MSGGFKDFCLCFWYRLICKNICLQNFSSNCIVCICSTDPRATCCTMKCHVVMWEQRLSFLFFFIPVCHFLSQILTFLSTFFPFFILLAFCTQDTSKDIFAKLALFFFCLIPFFTEKGKEDLSNGKLKFFGVLWV